QKRARCQIKPRHFFEPPCKSDEIHRASEISFEPSLRNAYLRWSLEPSSGEPFFALFRAGLLVKSVKCQMPALSPKAKPRKVKRGRQPQRSSNHCPPKPGSTISALTAKIRDTHSRASPIGGGCSEGGVTANRHVQQPRKPRNNGW